MRLLLTAILVGHTIIGCQTAETVEKKWVLDTIHTQPLSSDDIIDVTDPLVQPILYKSIPRLDHLPVAEAKSKFISALLPAILIAKHRIEQDYNRVMLLDSADYWNTEDSAFYEFQLAKYEAEDMNILQRRMLTHPNSIVLAQAIVESGWGSSRFFQKANNLFGVWSYNSSEPRIKAKFSRGDTTQVYLRKYDDLSQSIEDYFRTVAKSRAYRKFRVEREQSDDLNDLLPHLKYYSERREEYVEQLATIIRQNKLTQYDHYQIDPRYFVEAAVITP